MNTKLLMTVSSVIMGAVGIVLLFLPQELLAYFTSSGSAVDAIVLQIGGGLYFGFSMVNWTARANLIGGIYGRPIAMGNLTHFAIGALALLKGFSPGNPPVIHAATLLYAVFAVAFGIVIFRHPVAGK